MRINVFAILFLLLPNITHSYTVFIIIHGTWASNMTWHMPGGDFFNEIEKSAQYCDGGKAVSYMWSGSFDHNKRLYAAKGLVKSIQSYPTEVKICLVAHSHGANVGILASQLLGKDLQNTHHIHAFYALGTPVCNKEYVPDMHIIQFFYNFFSFGDFIQPIFGLFDREFKQHPRIVNLKVTIEGKNPLHTQLHHPFIAKWIPFIHERLFMSRLGSFETFDCKKPGSINFVEDRAPKYKVDKRMLYIPPTQLLS